MVTLGERFYQTIQSADGTALIQRKVLRFKNLTVADDSTGEVTVVSGPGTDRAVISFAAADFVGDTLTIPSEDVPFAYTDPMLQVVDANGESVLVGITTNPTDQTITITAEPFAGKLLIINT